MLGSIALCFLTHCKSYKSSAEVKNEAFCPANSVQTSWQHSLYLSHFIQSSFCFCKTFQEIWTFTVFTLFNCRHFYFIHEGAFLRMSCFASVGRSKAT